MANWNPKTDIVDDQNFDQRSEENITAWGESIADYLLPEVPELVIPSDATPALTQALEAQHGINLKRAYSDAAGKTAYVLQALVQPAVEEALQVKLGLKEKAANQ